VSSGLDLAAAPPSIPAPGPARKQNKASKKNATPASTPQEIENELLNRQLIATQTKLTSSENALRESRESYAILAKRLSFFEQRENDLNFSSPSRTQAGGTPPTSLATLPLLTEIGNIKCMLEELHFRAASAYSCVLLLTPLMLLHHVCPIRTLLTGLYYDLLPLMLTCVSLPNLKLPHHLVCPSTILPTCLYSDLLTLILTCVSLLLLLLLPRRA
jgi:hypothetical protein